MVSGIVYLRFERLHGCPFLSVEGRFVVLGSISGETATISQGNRCSHTEKGTEQLLEQLLPVGPKGIGLFPSRSARSTGRKKVPPRVTPSRNSHSACGESFDILAGTGSHGAFHSPSTRGRFYTYLDPSMFLTRRFPKRRWSLTGGTPRRILGFTQRTLSPHPHAFYPLFSVLSSRGRKQKQAQVHSFDLVSPNPLVTACDMASVPIKDASVHVAVFCLSLMGTNLADFLREAHRVLVPGGLVKVQ